MHTIYILLTRSGTLLSNLVHFFTGDPFTHASISFDPSLQPLYSSARKNGETMFPAGPCREYFHRGFFHKNRHIPCALYEIQVSEDQYRQALEETDMIISRSDEYRFNILGLILCKLNIPMHREKKYFCSQFVAEILKRSNALPLPKVPSLMRPMDYVSIPEAKCLYQGLLRDLVSERTGLVYAEPADDELSLLLRDAFYFLGELVPSVRIASFGRLW